VSHHAWLTVLLVYISLVMLSIFLYAFWPVMHIFCRNVYSGP
jgi:hypothetical protein